MTIVQGIRKMEGEIAVMHRMMYVDDPCITVLLKQDIVILVFFETRKVGIIGIFV